MPGELGYVDVTLGSSTDAPELHTFPFVVLIAPPLGTDPVEPTIGEFLDPNRIDLPPVGGLDLQVGALVRRSDATGQTVEFIIAPRPGLVDAEISLQINASVFSTFTDYGTNPTPALCVFEQTQL